MTEGQNKFVKQEHQILTLTTHEGGEMPCTIDSNEIYTNGIYTNRLLYSEQISNHNDDQ